MGADIYDVTFENGVVDVRISLAPDGKIQSKLVQPVQ